MYIRVVWVLSIFVLLVPLSLSHSFGQEFQSDSEYSSGEYVIVPPNRDSPESKLSKNIVQIFSVDTNSKLKIYVSNPELNTQKYHLNMTLFMSSGIKDNSGRTILVDPSWFKSTIYENFEQIFVIDCSGNNHSILSDGVLSVNDTIPIPFQDVDNCNLTYEFFDKDSELFSQKGILSTFALSFTGASNTVVEMIFPKEYSIQTYSGGKDNLDLDNNVISWSNSGTGYEKIHTYVEFTPFLISSKEFPDIELLERNITIDLGEKYTTDTNIQKIIIEDKLRTPKMMIDKWQIAPIDKISYDIINIKNYNPKVFSGSDSNNMLELENRQRGNFTTLEDLENTFSVEPNMIELHSPIPGELTNYYVYHVKLEYDMPTQINQPVLSILPYSHELNYLFTLDGPTFYKDTRVGIDFHLPENVIVPFNSNGGGNVLDNNGRKIIQFDNAAITLGQDEWIKIEYTYTRGLFLLGSGILLTVFALIVTFYELNKNRTNSTRFRLPLHFEIGSFSAIYLGIIIALDFNLLFQPIPLVLLLSILIAPFSFSVYVQKNKKHSMVTFSDSS